MIAGQRKPDAQWIADERKSANLDQRLKSLILSVLPDDQMNFVINCLTVKSTWDDLILYHERPSDVKESSGPKNCAITPLNSKKDFQDSPDDEEDKRSIHEYLNDLEEEYQAKALLAKSKRFFKKGTQRFSSAKATDQIECHKCGKKAPRSFSSKNIGIIAESHDWDEEEASSDNEETKVKALMALTDEERISVGKENARNGEWTKITIKSDPSAAVSDSPVPDYDLADESSVCSTLLLLLKKLDSVEPSYGPKTVKSILKSKSTFKAKTLKCITLNEPSSAPTGGNKNLQLLRLIQLLIISQRRGINLRNPQHITINYETCGRNIYTTSDHNDIEWFRKRETHHAKKAESSNALRSKTPTKRKQFTKSLNMYQEYLAEFWYSVKVLENSKVSFSIPTRGIYGEVGLNTFRNAIGAHYIPHSSEYVTPPSIDVVRKWFHTIGYGEEILIKGTLRKSLLPPSIANGIHIDYAHIFWEDIILKLKKKQIEKISQLKLILDYLLLMILYHHNKGASFTAIHGDKEEAYTAIHGDKEEASSTIKLEYLAKLVSPIQPSFKDLDSPEDDPVIIVDESDKHKPNVETKDTLVPRSSSPKSSQIQDSLPTELKDLPSKFNELTKEIKGTATSLTSQVAKLKTLQWELLKEFHSLPAKVESAQARLKTLDALPSLLLNVAKALNKFVEVLESTSTKAGDQRGAHQETQRQKVMSVEEAEKESLESDSDKEAYVTGFMFKSYKEKKLKKFDFVTEDGRHIHLSEEQINNQKKLEEESKAEAAK
uniref:Retrovirus-related Pol polyprotein from transposon TNT 1-94 n=1 Tax=Tanacetum cinerariifolium TaxID=118510 RepID=A0A699GLZ9_TANCI|nr:retrovirus-related Pol polyprotein from transposon TNT 1-94 [Tanacetum cinerariifolium]